MTFLFISLSFAFLQNQTNSIKINANNILPFSFSSKNQNDTDESFFLANKTSIAISIDINQLNSTGKFECDDREINFDNFSDFKSNKKFSNYSKKQHFLKECYTSESNFSYKFRGEKFIVYGIKSSKYGKFLIEIDGQKIYEINENSSTTEEMANIFESNKLEYKDHIIRIINTGDKFSLVKLVYWPTLASKRKNINKINKTGNWITKTDKFGQNSKFTNSGGTLNINFNFKRLWLYYVCNLSEIKQINKKETSQKLLTSSIDLNDHFHIYEIQKSYSIEDQLTISIPNNFSLYFVYYEEQFSVSDAINGTQVDPFNSSSLSVKNETDNPNARNKYEGIKLPGVQQCPKKHCSQKEILNEGINKGRKNEKEDRPDEIIIEDVYFDSCNNPNRDIVSKTAFIRNNTFDMSKSTKSCYAYQISSFTNLTMIDCQFLSPQESSIYYFTISSSSDNYFLYIENCTFKDCKANCLSFIFDSQLSGSYNKITISKCCFDGCSKKVGYETAIAARSISDSIELNIINSEFKEWKYGSIDDVIYLYSEEKKNSMIIENSTFHRTCRSFSIANYVNASINECLFDDLQPFLFKLRDINEITINKCNFSNCTGNIDISYSIIIANIEECIFSDVYSDSLSVLTIYNQQCRVNNNTINFTSNEIGKSCPGLCIGHNGRIQITNNKFINNRPKDNFGIIKMIEDSKVLDLSTNVVSFNYNLIENVADGLYGIFYIEKKYLFEINHNIVKNCKMSDFSSCIKLLNSNYLNNDFCITNITFINCSAGGRVGGGFGLWFEVPRGKTLKLTLKDCLFEGNVAHNNGGNDLDGFGGAFGTGLGSMDRMTLIIDNCTFIKNKAQRKGGAISIQSSYPTYILNCTFINNEAEEGGGAIFIMPYRSTSDKELIYTIQECHFESNKDLSGNNNAIFNSNPSSHMPDSKLIIKDCNFTNNNSSDTYSNEGYAISIESGKISIEGTQIEFIGDSSQSVTGLKVINVNELSIKKCKISGIAGALPIIFTSKSTIIDDLYIDLPEPTLKAFDVEYNGPITINHLKIYGQFDNLMELSLPSNYQPIEIDISNTAFTQNLLKFKSTSDASFEKLNTQNCQSTLNNEDTCLVYLVDITTLNVQNSIITSCISHELFHIDSYYPTLLFKNTNIDSNHINNNQKSFFLILREYDEFSNHLFENFHSDIPVFVIPESQTQVSLNEVTFKNCYAKTHLIISLNSNLDISNSNFIFTSDIIDKQSGDLNIFNSNFLNCLGDIEIKKSYPNANIEKCVFSDCLGNDYTSVIAVSNTQCTLINNIINFTSNENGKSIGGLYVNANGNIEIIHNQFINIRKTNQVGITINESEGANIGTNSLIIFNYNTVVNCGNVEFGVFMINKKNNFDFNHNIIKNCAMHSGYSSHVYLQEDNALNNDFTVINLTFDNCVSNAVTGGGIGLLLEFGNKKEGTLTLKDCKFTNNIIEKDGTGSGCGGAFETGNYTASKLEFIADNCKFTNNHASNCGGALSIQSTLSAIIKNCTFSSNEAKQGGGAIYIYPKEYESEPDFGQMPSCTILGCKFELNKDTSNNGHAVFFKYANKCTTEFIIKECNFIDNISPEKNSNEGFAISTESPIFTIENVQINFNDWSQTAHGLKVSKQTEKLTLEKCSIRFLFLTNQKPSCVISSKTTLINDLKIIGSSKYGLASIEFEYNGPISINQLRIDNYERAIEFPLFCPDQPIQVSFSNCNFKVSQAVIKITDDTIRSIHGFNFTSCTAESFLWSFSPDKLDTTVITDCHFSFTNAYCSIYYRPNNHYSSTESLFIGDCTFEGSMGAHIGIISQSGSSETITISNCNFDNKENRNRNELIYVDGESDSINLNIINNVFKGYTNIHNSVITFKNRQRKSNDPIMIENDTFILLTEAIQIDHEGGSISIRDCIFQNVTRSSINVMKLTNLSITKCNFTNIRKGIDVQAISSGYEFINRELNIEYCIFDHSLVDSGSSIYIQPSTNSMIDISKCSFINVVNTPYIIYSNANMLCVHDISFDFENINCNSRPIFLGPKSETKIYNISFIKCSMNNEEGTAIKAESEARSIEVTDCKFENCKDTGSSIQFLGSNCIFHRNIFICTNMPTSSGLNIPNAYQVEIINCSFTKISSTRTGSLICPLSIQANTNNEYLTLIGLNFTDCCGRNPTCFNIVVYHPFTFENLTIKNNVMDQFETYAGIIDLNECLGEDPLTFKYCQYINNSLFTQYGSGAGIMVKNKPKLKFEFENCLFKNNKHCKNGGGFQEGGSADNVNRILTFRECRFENNEAGEKGGGISIETVLQFTIEGCTFNNNRAEMGGAIYINPAYGSIPNEYGIIANCEFNNNEATKEHGTILFIENSKAKEITFDGTNKITNKGERGSTIYSQCGNLRLVDVLFDFKPSDEAAIERNFRSIQLIEGSITTLTNCKFVGTGFTTSPTSGHAILAEKDTKKVSFENCVFTDCGNSDSQYAIDSFASELEFISSEINFTDAQISCGGIKINKCSKFTMINSTFKNCYANCTSGGGFCYNLDKLGKEVDCDVSITGCTFDNLVSSNGNVGMLSVFKSITISNCTIKSMPKTEYLLAIEYVSEQEQIILDKIIFIENQINISNNGSECALGLFISKAQRCIFQDCQFIRNTNIKEVNCSTIICGEATSNNNVQYEFVGCYFEDNKIDKDLNGGALYINARYKPVQIDSCVFSNTASDVSERGGAIYISSDTEQEIMIINSHFINMKVSTSDSDSGNAIYIDNTSSKVHIEGCQFNDCGNKGCVISSYGHYVIIENTVIAFKEMSPIKSCQGIIIKSKSHFELINASISNCISPFGGGAFSYLLNGSNYEDNDELVLIENCHFKLNKAVQNGGAVAIESFGLIRIINSTFEENIANYKNIANSKLLADNQYRSTNDGKGGSIYIYPYFDSSLSRSSVSTIEIEKCIFKNNEAPEGSSIYLAGEYRGNKISIKGNEFTSKMGSSSVILTEICSFSYNEISSGNTFKIDNGGSNEGGGNILMKDCRYPPGFSFSPTYEFTFSSTFSASNKYTESADSESLSSIQNPPQIISTITITKSSQKSELAIITSSTKTSEETLPHATEVSLPTATNDPTPNVVKVTYSKSFSVSYTNMKSVSFSLSNVLSNTYQVIYDQSRGTYTMVITQMYYQSYFPYIIYFLSPVYIERNVPIELMPRKRISQEQLIGVTCGSASAFFLILGIIILVVRKRRENIEQSEDFIYFSSDEGEICLKKGETNIYENEFANEFPQDYSDLLI